ncbi:hypothetical protein [Klenkia taihuensis]|uniref:Uncharacterized protein n=1 Tax=Klenkia taihuensis TaxID=1225127 RepID=A0A1I1Q698_9ACTN|nr:hypothetical protein [Klenkia taihuensis]SFD17641.1 hypothetical protein SAMN05661030_2628 [Klenkia taihuensis]
MDQRAVRDLLWEWDLIGLRDDDSPLDEYDCMIGPLLALRARGAGAGEIAAWVGSHAEEHFGLPSTSAADLRLAHAVLALP